MRPTTPARPAAEPPPVPASVFLTAEWRDLVVANYEVPSALLRTLVPAGTELDFWEGRTYVSLVGFRFLRTKVWGIAFPFHRNFEEVNLRFYVRRKTGHEWRRGVVFIKEIVPRRAIAWAARRFYNENYAAMPMTHRLEATPLNRQVAYSWKPSSASCGIAVGAQNESRPLVPGSMAEFILEHYWGYSRQRSGSTLEYQVEHPPWRTQTVLDCTVEGDLKPIYGPVFGELLQTRPASVFLAEGSPVTVRKGVPLP